MYLRGKSLPRDRLKCAGPKVERALRGSARFCHFRERRGGENLRGRRETFDVEVLEVKKRRSFESAVRRLE